MRASLAAVEAAGYRQPWGADADGLKTSYNIEMAAEAGFTFYTLDLSDLLCDAADGMSADELDARIASMILDGDLPEDWSEPYLGRSIDLPGDWRLELTLEPLQRAAVKFAQAVQHGQRLYETLVRTQRGRAFEIEVCLDQTARPVTPLEHLFVGLELEARGLRATSLALSFVETSEPELEKRLREHVAVAQFCGPYKLSIHGSSDRFGVYPVLGRICGEQLHLKTAGASYLEGLRAVAQVDPGLFREVARYGLQHAPVEGTPARAEPDLLDHPAGRRMLLATRGSLLTEARTEDGRLFGEALVGTLQAHANLHHEIIAAHFEKHLRLLSAG